MAACHLALLALSRSLGSLELSWWRLAASSEHQRARQPSEPERRRESQRGRGIAEPAQGIAWTWTGGAWRVVCRGAGQGRGQGPGASSPCSRFSGAPIPPSPCPVPVPLLPSHPTVPRDPGPRACARRARARAAIEHSAIIESPERAAIGATPAASGHAIRPRYGHGPRAYTACHRHRLARGRASCAGVYINSESTTSRKNLSIILLSDLPQSLAPRVAVWRVALVAPRFARAQSEVESKSMTEARWVRLHIRFQAMYLGAVPSLS